jgi:hypothetical protein
MRGAKTADLADTDEQAVDDNCNMAQAFKIERETGQRILACFATDVWLRSQSTQQRFPDRRSRSDPLTGSATGIWDCRRIAASAERLRWRDLRPTRFPARLSGARLIFSARFDKGSHAPAWRCDALAHLGVTGAAALSSFSLEPILPAFLRAPFEQGSPRSLRQEKSPAETAGLLLKETRVRISSQPG